MPMDRQDIKISVIIPIYNVEKYLHKCILSVINQTFRNLEIILVNDGSPDNCPLICDQYKCIDDRVVVVHKSNGGLSDARNAGLDIATGEYIAFLDGDDTFDVRAIETLLDAAVQSSAKIVKMQFRNVLEDEAILNADFGENVSREWIKNTEYIKRMCTYKASCSCCDKFFHRSVFENYRFRKGITNEDLLLLGTILLEKGYDIYSLNYKGYNYLQRAQSITKSGFGRSVRDTIYNCVELQEIAERKRADVCVYLQMLSLYQARTFLLLMPKNYVKQKNEDYLFAIKSVKMNKKTILNSFFSFKDKLFLTMCLMSVSFAKMITDVRKKHRKF